MTKSKSAIRREQKLAREAVPPGQRRTAATAALKTLRGLQEYMASGRVAVYFPIGGELDTSSVCVDLWQRRKECYLPVIVENSAVSLMFARYNTDSPMQPNDFGIPEPRVGPQDLLPAQHLDLILLPLTAFDRNGNRVGMGGGYYDRALAFRHTPGHQRRPRLFGLGYALQEVQNVPAEDNDVRLDGIITEHEIIRPNNN